MTARVIIALAACAAAFEHEQRACPGDQPTNVSDTIFNGRGDDVASMAWGA